MTEAIQAHWEALKRFYPEKPPEGYRFRSPLELVMLHGVESKPVLAAERMIPRQCYRNAGTLATDEPGRYIYVEGLAVYRHEFPFPVEHAWVFDRELGKAVEVTWAETGVEYLGIHFRETFVRGMVLATGYWGILMNRAVITTEVDPEGFIEKVPV